MNVIDQQRILDEIAVERFRQFQKWGDQRLTATHWIAVLGEEFGEAAKEAVEFEAMHDEERLIRLRAELIQTAAVAVSMIEWIDDDARYPDNFKNPIA